MLNKIILLMRTLMQVMEMYEPIQTSSSLPHDGL